jgi:hypothetical protein
VESTLRAAASPSYLRAWIAASLGTTCPITVTCLPASFIGWLETRSFEVPSGNGTDNVQLGFNILPVAKKAMYSHPQGTMPRYMVYPDTDYEFALNAVAERFGGGTEIFCLQRPGMVRKHFFPRQPAAKIDGGPVKAGKLVMRRDGNTRIVEAALPWSALPEVKRELDARRTVKFSFRVNDNQGPAYELAADRSVSKENPLAFHNDWATHWANEIEFGAERQSKARAHRSRPSGWSHP